MGADRINTTPFVSEFRPALIDIISGQKQPYDSILTNLTSKAEILKSTSIILIDLDESTNQPRGRQIVYSSAKDRPWGFSPRCNNHECKPSFGNIETKSSTNNAQILKCIRLRCLYCHYQTWVTRPDWVEPVNVPKADYYFVTPWPLSREQIMDATGLNERWVKSEGSRSKINEPQRKKSELQRGERV